MYYEYSFKETFTDYIDREIETLVTLGLQIIYD